MTWDSSRSCMTNKNNQHPDPLCRGYPAVSEAHVIISLAKDVGRDDAGELIPELDGIRMVLHIHQSFRMGIAKVGRMRWTEMDFVFGQRVCHLSHKSAPRTRVTGDWDIFSSPQQLTLSGNTQVERQETTFSTLR